jgi:hypothetical protein
MRYGEYLKVRLERYAPYLCAVAAIAGMRARNPMVAIVALWTVGLLFTGLLSLFWLCGIGGRELRHDLPRLRRPRR